MGARAATALHRAHLSAPLPQSILGDRPVHRAPKSPISLGECAESLGAGLTRLRGYLAEMHVDIDVIYGGFDFIIFY